ncbi:MAG TPA: hypothetical protein VHG93_18470, partial [Longimicrobium sp.]|nr:hypothetical protein [Longimicrobium sp.]
MLLAAGLLVLALFRLGVADSTFPYPTTGERIASLAAIAGACGAVGADPPADANPDHPRAFFRFFVDFVAGKQTDAELSFRRRRLPPN